MGNWEEEYTKDEAINIVSVYLYVTKSEAKLFLENNKLTSRNIREMARANEKLQSLRLFIGSRKIISN